MRPLHRATLLSGLALLFTGVSVGAQSIQRESQPSSTFAPAPAPAPAAAATGRAIFAGVWAYNAEDSLNAANGRKEDGTTQRRAGAGSASGGRGGGTSHTGVSSGGLGGNGNGGGSGSGPGGFGGYGGGGQPSPFTSLVVNERRDLVRDLMEVPVELKIKVTDAAITFVDHLDRELTYPTSGKKQKYQLSASEFFAKAYWDGLQLRKDIEANDGFKMRETYFVSENGKRLFVIVRVGDPQDKDKDAPVVGVNRVYDRVLR
jgi:hypothetical protein